MNTYKLGIDIGSTTVKIAILDENNQILFSDYERHFANIQETLQQLLEKAVDKLGTFHVHPVITGSGGLTLATHLNVPFTQSYLSELVAEFGTVWLQSHLFSKIFYLPEDCRSDINAMLSLILAEHQSSDIFSNCMLKMYFQTLVVRILRYINDASILIVNNNTRATDEALQIAVDYINEHFKNNITLDDMAELLHLNPSYFSKKFKSANGLGFKEYLNNVRINHSEKLLLETGMSITEIAFECGYDNSNYYGDAFKKVNGVSPSTFRKLKGNIVDR